MTQTPEPSPRAQAILRAIENEAQARRERSERLGVADATPPAEPLAQTADRLMRLVDHVVAQTEGVRARVREIEQSLDLLSDKLSEPVMAGSSSPETLKPETLKPELPAEPAPPPVAEIPTPVVQTPPAAPIEPPAPEPVAPESDGARLMAIEMAVSGSSRGEVGDRLAHDFGVADPTPFLDDDYGAGSADDSRMPWTS
jgi:hypothetical protein